ncbi:glyoxylase-like metal-dependent hydrolase (beta-lactamase superfamily II) [Psychromicrobium silvestre]|uniref:Glyoxylase-like metal-dependent hydrolase (Beta-lactamase superfamily II) n=1 Tax=Psychromicrobium silvestre TaxID=1645614 RepID=A0A7Y9LVF8_9MICC|nr:MBL fold metallo-hydrolase [Psychromicrobium silvestre]NYE96354.1 glyoxylase-like metal-dependent hydrolase (beta-lactamase superfamily II) [Psychromicrobium silvestre]
MTGTLGYDVLILEPIPQNVDTFVPNGDRFMWSPQSTILIYGERNAILIDPPFTTKQGRQVADWINASGKNLTHIIATHGHGDHWFTAPALAEEFGAQLVASQGTIDLMRLQVEQRSVSWDILFPGQIGETPITAIVPQDLTINLEGHQVRIVEVGHSDTEDTTVIHVADLELVVGGDVIYNGVHQYLSESAGGGLEKWLTAVDLVEALEPRLVVSGHKNPALDDDAPRAIRETREYLTTARSLLPRSATARDFFDAMMERFPDRLNPTALWMSASALYPES